jgi:hypothetical protein
MTSMRGTKSNLRTREDGSRQADGGQVLKENWPLIVRILNMHREAPAAARQPQRKQG